MFNNGKGFTLIEVMTALTVLAISFVILLGLRNRDIKISEKSAHLIQATLLAQKKMADLSLEKNKDTGTRNGDFGDAFPDYRWEMEIHETPRKQLRELILKVLWGKKTNEENVSFTRYIIVTG